MPRDCRFIERRRDAPNEEFRAVADGKPVIDHVHGAVGDEALDPWPVDDRGSRSRPCNWDKRGRSTAIAHDPCCWRGGDGETTIEL